MYVSMYAWKLLFTTRSMNLQFKKRLSTNFRTLGAEVVEEERAGGRRRWAGEQGRGPQKGEGRESYTGQNIYKQARISGWEREIEKESVCVFVCVCKTAQTET